MQKKIPMQVLITLHNVDGTLTPTADMTKIK